MGSLRAVSSPKPKSLSPQAQLGQRGVHLIEGIVLEMGSRWIPGGPTEVGIDGFIELFDPVTHAALGKIIAIQSKAVTDFAANTPDSFEYWCSQRDIAYWLHGNMPVILVVSQPKSGEAYWISIKDYFLDGSTPIKSKIVFNKQRDRLLPSSLAQLLAIAQPRSTGLYLAPLPKRETLISNLVPLVGIPDMVYLAYTDLRRGRDVWPALGSERNRGAWLLDDKRIISFHDLTEQPWPKVCDRGTVEPIPTREWSESFDPDRSRQFVRLLNQTLRSQLHGVRYWSNEDCYAFTIAPGQAERRIPYQSVRQHSRITVVKRYESTKPDRTFHWFRHLAFRGWFRRIEGSWFLEITPTYRFTADGIFLDRFHADRLSTIKRIEGNRAVLSSVLFWADYLQRPTELFDDTPLLLRFGPARRFDIDCGLDDASWLKADPRTKASRDADTETLPLPFEESEVV